MAKKQPSGKWRASAYLGKDENGKRIYKTFTAPTKKEAEYKAMMYKLEYEESAKNVDNPTMAEAFSRYIESKSNVLSPATIRGYIRISRTELTGYHLSEKRVNDISNEDIQRAVNEYALNHSPKSVRNFHGLISAVLGVFRPSMKLTTSLPQRKRTKLYLPTDEDIKALIKATEGEEIEKAIMLAAFGSLRRSEIAALTGDDIDGNYITVSKAMVLNNDNEWVIKSPKTYAGYRTIEMPEFVIAKLPKKGPVTTLSPNKITQRFAAALKKSDCPHFRFHDLRHYQASILHAMGVPDKYIIARGGWRTEATLKNIYQHTMDKKRQEVETQICCRFTQMMQPECNKNEDKPHKKAI